MSDFLRDPALDELVRKLNSSENSEAVLFDEDGESSEPERKLQPRRTVAEANDPLARLLSGVVKRGATDLLLVPGSAPILRVGGRLVQADAAVVEEDEIRASFAPHVTNAWWRELDETGAVDFSLHFSGEGSTGWRFRVNLHRQRLGLSASIRVLPREVPTLASLNLPVGLAELIKPNRGLVLVCGPTGAGKTSTLAALVGEINRTRTSHIITIEDPIEYEHVSERSLIEQIELGADSSSFAHALRAALRQDPDVILVGEMRDLETIATALTAAETGHLVLSTLHTHDAAQAIHRMVDVFPAAQQTQIRQQLALSLHAICCQQLIPRASGNGRVPAIELLLANPAIRHHIRREKTQNLHQEITLGKRQGMITLEESLARLVSNGAITLEEAQIRTAHPEDLETLMRSV